MVHESTETSLMLECLAVVQVCLVKACFIVNLKIERNPCWQTNIIHVRHNTYNVAQTT